MKYGGPVQPRRGGRTDRSERPLALVVEDDPDAAAIGSAMLEMLGWETIVAETGEEALFALANCPPDLVLLDVCLPDVDGLGVLRVVRRLASTRDVPVVVASAIHKRSGPQARLMRDLGAPDFLSKPFGLKELRKAVDAATTAARARRAWAEQNASRSTPHNPAIRRANVLFGGRAVEVVLEGRDGDALLLRSWAEPLPDGGAVEVEVADPALGRVRILGLVADVRPAGAGAGWTARLDLRMSFPAAGFEHLLGTLSPRR